MLRWSLPAICVALSVLLAACDPFETEVTLNADGSGTLVQKAHLSADALAMLQEYAVPSLREYRPVLDEKQAQAWSETRRPGVHVRSWHRTPEADGSAHIRCEVEFTDLKALAASPWGWPLQLAVAARPEAQLLQCDSPARFVLMVFAAIHAPTLSDLDQMGGANPLEFLPKRDVLLQLLPGFKTRTVLRLPVAALHVEEGDRSSDGRTVTVERCVGAGWPGIVEWLNRKPAAITLPKSGQPKPFATPLTLAHAASLAADRPMRQAPAATMRKEDGYSLSGAVARIVRDSSPVGNPLRPRAGRAWKDDRAQLDGRSLLITFTFEAPASACVLDSLSWPFEGQEPHLLSAARDGDGNDLRSEMATLRVTPPQPAVGRIAKSRGTAAIRLKAPPGNSTVLRKLEGYFTVVEVLEEGTLELRPARDFLNQAFDIRGQQLRILRIEGREAELSVAQRARGARMSDPFRWVGPDGKECASSGAITRMQGANRTLLRTFDKPLPADVAAILSYPVRIREIKVPFSLTDQPIQ